MLPRALLPLALLTSLVVLPKISRADPLSKRTEIDFYRDVPSRNLVGLAARSDGRLVAGPALHELSGTAPADLFWCLAPGADASRWLVGTGPDGRIFEITLDAAKNTYVSRELAKLDEPHVFALVNLPDGTVLAGTSPKGGLCLLKDGKVVARVGLPVDSIFDLLVSANSSAAQASPTRVLVGTGNPGRVYQVDLAKFARSGVSTEKTSDAKLLAERGVTLFGEIRDRNVRRLAQLVDGRVIAGSAPKGNIYAFPAAGGAPVILQENRDAEVTDLLPSPDGGLFATLTFAGGTGESRITPPKGGKDTIDLISSSVSAAEKFSGRSNLVWFPPNGFAETLTSRGSTAFYRLARQGDLILLTGGEQGEILGYDLKERLSLTFAGSASSQLSGLAPMPGQPGRFLVLRNNAPGFAILDFNASQSRQAETRRIDLGAPARVGALRFNRLRDLADGQPTVEAKTSNGTDEIEGWTSWTVLNRNDGGWSSNDLRGRYVKFRIKLPADSAGTSQLDKASLFALPQNRRPQLQEFHLLTTNFALVPAPTPTPASIVSVGQLLQNAGPKDEDAKLKSGFLGSQIVPSPGTQVALWTVTDPDGDTVLTTFSLRKDGEDHWTELARNTADPYVQFDTSHLKEGLYFTRLVATETDPRPAGERLTTTFETDDLLIDHTPPEIVDASAKRDGEKLVITVHGRDTSSLLDGIEATFNNATHAQTEQPLDGIRDAREETFVLEFPVSRTSGATSVEVTLYDALGNATSRRLTW